MADQLNLPQPGGAHYPHPVLRAPPDFQTLRQPCMYNAQKVQKYALNSQLQALQILTNDDEVEN